MSERDREIETKMGPLKIHRDRQTESGRRARRGSNEIVFRKTLLQRLNST